MRARLIKSARKAWVSVWVKKPVSTRINKLSALGVQRVKKPGLHGDGGGLYLQVGPKGSKSWIFRYKSDGRTRYMGLGSLITVSLSEARQEALNCRKLRQQRLDPIGCRKETRMAAQLAAAETMTFDDCRDAYIAAHGHSWRNKKHRAQWTNTLTTYASPIIGNLSIQDIDVGLVMKVLKPIWTTKPETAGRLRGRIERILDWAKASGCRKGENPARWKGHLDQLLPARSKIQKVRHHPALPFSEIPDFFINLRKQLGVAARALEFVVLTAARTGEALGATWNEVDLDGRTWTVPTYRMKGGREHRVPLSDQALAVLNQVQLYRVGEFVFPGGKEKKTLSNMALLKTLDRMKRGDITTHGFRSTFRTWAAGRTSFPREVVEAALAHAIENKVEAAYQRSDLFDKRRTLMEEWGKYCAGQRG